MSFDYIRKIATPEEIIEKLPLTKEAKIIKEKRDEELKEILRGENNRLIIVIGPCSADNPEAVIDYVTRLSKVNEKVKDKLFIIPRVYTNKPRTNGAGYKGMLHQPNLDERPNLANGIEMIRKLHIKVIEETNLITADEMLYPENFAYLEDIIGYNAVGARSVENQGHRLVASGINTPVGMKNPMCGDLSVMVNAVNAAQIKQEFIYHGWEVKSTGNEYAHAILRGYLGPNGESIPNYHYENLLNAIKLYDETTLKNPAILVDVSHSNSNKEYKQQSRIAKEILHSIKSDEKIKKYVKGLMIESYIVEGKQDICENRVYGKSVTDACIGWEETEKLLYYIADNI